MTGFILGLFFLVLGGFNCFWGYRSFRLIISAWGFLIGYLIGLIAGGSVITGVIGGIVGVFAFSILYSVGIALIGAALGGGLALALVLLSTLSTAGVGAIVTACIAAPFGAVMGGYAFVKFEKPAIILFTALGGAYLIVFGFRVFVGDGEDALVTMITFGELPFLARLGWFSLGAFGVAVQYGKTQEIAWYLRHPEVWLGKRKTGAADDSEPMTGEERISQFAQDLVERLRELPGEIVSSGRDAAHALKGRVQDAVATFQEIIRNPRVLFEDAGDDILPYERQTANRLVWLFIAFTFFSFFLTAIDYPSSFLRTVAWLLLMLALGIAILSWRQMKRPSMGVFKRLSVASIALLTLHLLLAVVTPSTLFTPAIALIFVYFFVLNKRMKAYYAAGYIPKEEEEVDEFAGNRYGKLYDGDGLE